MSAWFWPPGGSEWRDPAAASPQGESLALLRLRRAFMGARGFIAATLLILQVLSLGFERTQSWAPLFLSAIYLAAALLVWRFARLQTPMRSLGGAWWAMVGVDLAVFSLLQWLQAGHINYTPLFALPVLMAAALGTLPIGLGTAATVTLLLLAEASWQGLLLPGEVAVRFFQAALTGTGLFMVALLAHELAQRLIREEDRSARSQQAAQLHARVSDLVIETLGEGVLVLDAQGLVHTVNPAADAILGHGLARMPQPFRLRSHPAWALLAALADDTFARRTGQSAEIPIPQAQGPAREIRVLTHLTAAAGGGHAPGLCVMFLHDLRELEARVRTEKLAAMGRMSAAVAHEIRNPLAAIAQASALLAEDLVDPAHRRLTAMVQHNAQRLARIVDDVLDVSRARQQRAGVPGEPIMLDDAVHALVQEWMRHTRCQSPRLSLQASNCLVPFDGEHLRRILVNLLDNAARYAGCGEGAIRIATHCSAHGQGSLAVWSGGAALEPAVQDHLFEPFFSSESRSSGLGLFICRELCERHGARIGYKRCKSEDAGPQGNEFCIVFAPCPRAADTPVLQPGSNGT